MGRRVAAVLGIVVLVALALTLLWRVYAHHESTIPYGRDEEGVTISHRLPEAEKITQPRA